MMVGAQTMIPVTLDKLLAPRRPTPKIVPGKWRGEWRKGESGPKVWRGPEGGLWSVDNSIDD